MDPSARPDAPAAAVAAWSAAAVAVGAAVAAVAVLAVAGSSPSGSAASPKQLLLTAILVVPGLLIATARPRSALGWLILGEAVLFGMAALGTAWVTAAGGTGDASVAWAAWVSDRFSAFLAVGIWLVLLLLPDGRLPSPRWRPVVGVVVAAQCLLVTAFVLVRGPAAAPDTSLPPVASDVGNPVGLLPAGLTTTLDVVAVFLLQLPLLLCPVAYVVRLRRAAPPERARIVGVLLAASTMVVLVVLGHLWWPEAAEMLDVLAAAVLAAELTATVLGRRPRAVSAVVRQTFVHTVLAAAVGSLAVLVAFVLHRYGHEPSTFGIAAVAAGAGLALQPLRTRLARTVDRLMYGDLHDPYRVLQRLAERTHRAPSVDAVLEGLAATAAVSLRLPCTTVHVGGRAAVWGERPSRGYDVRVDVLSGTAVLGTLTVVADRPLSSEETGMLEDLGRHGGMAVQAALLADRLREGRQRLVLAREEERRRLRRDLHDDVGPTLAGLAMQLGVVRTLVDDDPRAAADRLVLLQDAARTALATLRRMAHDLRPPALDELGVAGALERLAASLGLRLGLDAPEDLRLPAAVEVAAYRIGAEALHNVVRHASADRVEVRLALVDDDLVLVVRDDGAGRSPEAPAGVGLLGMRERADELGGSVVVDSAPGAGTTVTARLPARPAVPEEVPA